MSCFLCITLKGTWSQRDALNKQTFCNKINTAHSKLFSKQPVKDLICGGSTDALFWWMRHYIESIYRQHPTASCRLLWFVEDKKNSLFLQGFTLDSFRSLNRMLFSFVCFLLRNASLEWAEWRTISPTRCTIKSISLVYCFC